LKDLAQHVKPLSEEEERNARQQLLTERLKLATESEPRSGRWIAQEVLALYGKDDDLAKHVEEARTLLKGPSPEKK
jgi:hypothetical protein